MKVTNLPLWALGLLGPVLALTVMGCGNGSVNVLAGLNTPPIAAAGLDQTVNLGETVFFSGSGSLDQDGIIAAYAWDFGDDVGSDTVTAEHVYTLAGTFTVTLTVTDNDDNTHSDTMTVTVLSTPASQFSLMMNVVPQNSGEVSFDPPGGRYDEGTTVKVTATPGPGFSFASYSDDQDVNLSQEIVYSIIVDRDTALTALFIPIELGSFQVMVSATPAEAGLFNLDPPGGVYEAGATVALDVVPNVGFAFQDIIDNHGSVITTQPFHLITVNADQVLTARFVALPPVMATLSVGVTPADTGTIILDPPGGTYQVGTQVTLTAEPVRGYGFVKYFGGVSATQAVATVTITGNTTVQAEFAWSPQLGNPGNLLVTNFAGNSVLEFDRFDGTLLGRIVQRGAGDLSLASGIDFGPDGNLYVNGFGNDAIMRFDGLSGELMGSFASLSGEFTALFFHFGPDGNLYVSDAVNNNILKYDGTTGEYLEIFVNPRNSNLFLPVGMRFNATGNLFVVSQGNSLVIEYEGITGNTIGTYANLGALGFSIPIDLAFNQAGDLFVTTSGNDSVARIAADTGAITTFISPGSGGLNSPAGIQVHPDTGHVLVTNQSTDQIFEYDGITGEFVGVFATGVPGEVAFFMAFRPR